MQFNPLSESCLQFNNGAINLFWAVAIYEKIYAVVGVQSTEFFCYSTLHQQHEFKKTYYDWIVGENFYSCEFKEFEHQRRN